jgi:hypothetical protein
VTLRRCKRDEAVREHAERFCGGFSELSVSKRLAGELRQYRSGRWRRERFSDSPPASPVRASLWRILKLVDTALSERQIRRILRTRDPAFHVHGEGRQAMS